MMQRVTRHITLGEMAEPITEVLLVCTRCGLGITRTLTGHWTLEQLQAKPNREVDADFFRKIGVKL